MVASSIHIEIPNISLFPEIDLASKISSCEHSSLDKPLRLLNNAGSLEIQRRLANQRFYARLSDDEYRERSVGQLILTLQDNEKTNADQIMRN